MERMNILIVVDMQNDFVDGVLGTKDAVKILPRVREKIQAFRGKILYTKDTHGADYLNTQEGRNLPVEHCIKGTKGWRIHPSLEKLSDGEDVIEKPTFGSVELGMRLQRLQETEEISAVTLIGVCTDICVISNAMIVKAFLPEVPVYVDASCCAGVTPQSHEDALQAMEVCQIKVLRKGENDGN